MRELTLLHDTWYVFLRLAKKLMRSPALILISLVQPIFYLFFFSQIFSKLTSLPGFPTGSYVEYLTPGVLVMSALMSGLTSGTSIVHDMESEYLQKMLVTPVSRLAIILGRLNYDAVRVTIQSVILVVLAYALGATVATGIPGILLLIFIVAFFALAISGLSLGVGMVTKNSDAMYALAIFLLFPLLFLSTALLPTFLLPTWAQGVSSFNPVTYVSNAGRDLMLGVVSSHDLLLSFISTGLVALLTMGAALYEFRRVVS